MSEGPKVLIIGAGLGGLALAQSLRQKGIRFEIFERDESDGSRVQGWAVALHKIVSELKEITPSEGPPLESVGIFYGTDLVDEATLCDAYTLERRGTWDASKQTWIRANRLKLRNWLMTGIDVKWNKRCLSYEVSDDGVTALFEDGSKASGTILVGADGVSSRVRDQIFQPDPPVPRTLPVGLIVGLITLSPEQYKRQFAIARSFYLARGRDARFFVGCKGTSPDLSSTEHYWMLSFIDEGITRPGYWMESASAEERLDWAREKIQDFHPDLQEIVQIQSADGIHKPFVIRDLVPQPISEGPATIIGDAAHAMSFFQGEGAVHAMTDALRLSKLLKAAVDSPSSEGISWSNVLREYESEMIPRASEAVLRSREAAFTIALDTPASWKSD